MSDTIIAALIGAVTSVLVAVIGTQTAQGKSSGSPSLPGLKFPTRPWVITTIALSIWLLVTPGVIHHDFSGINFFIIPIVVLLLALISPIRPLTASWVTLSIFSLNFVLGPLGNRLAGSRYDTAFGLEFSKLLPLLMLGVITALIAWGVCALRLRHGNFSQSLEDVEKTIQNNAPVAGQNLAAGLEQLAKLHSDGKLSDDEFKMAKNRLIKGD